jgi:hypothetical protein
VVSTDADSHFSCDWLSRIDAAFSAVPAPVAVAGPCRFENAPWWGRLYSWSRFHVVHLIGRVAGRITYVTATNLAFY